MRMKNLGVLGALMLGSVATLCAGARAEGGAVGMVVAVKGQPQLMSAGGLGKLRLGTRLAGGAIVRCPPNSEATVVLFVSGDLYRIRSKSQVIVSAAMSNALKLPPRGAASANVARQLAGSRTGAAISRRAKPMGPLDAAFGFLTDVDATQDLAAGSRPDAGFVVEGSRLLSWKGDHSIRAASPALRDYVLWTLYDSDSNIVFHTKIVPQIGGQVQVQIPADVELATQKAYVWRAVSYEQVGERFQPLSTPARWGIVTWVSNADALRLASLLPVASVDAPAKLASREPERALILASLLHDMGIQGGAWRLLQALRDAKVRVQGADDAFFELYNGLPAMAQLFGAQIPFALSSKAEQEPPG